MLLLYAVGSTYVYSLVSTAPIAAFMAAAKKAVRHEYEANLHVYLHYLLHRYDLRTCVYYRAV